MTRFAFRGAMVALSYIASLDLVLWMLGWVNQFCCRRMFKTATLFYFADSRYLQASTFAWYARTRRWRPCLVGGYSLGDVAGFTCVVGASEQDILDGANHHRLIALHARMNRVAQLLRLASVSYSGILPSVLARAGVKRVPIEVDRTVHWVVQAVRQILAQGDLPPDTVVIVLGACGHVGARLCDVLRSEMPNSVVEIDPLHCDANKRDAQQSFECMAAMNCRALVLNVSRSQVLEKYVEILCPGCVVLNEVYPEVETHTLVRLAQRGVRYVHLQGVHGLTWPSFPGAYCGAVPLCAASAASESLGSRAMQASREVLLRDG